MKWQSPFFLRHDAMRLGWPGAAGAILLVVCAVAQFTLVIPARERADAARRSVVSLQQRLDAQAAASKEGVLGVDEQLAAFYAALPREQDAADAIGRVAALAMRQGLQVQQADYRVERDRTGKLVRLQMQLPLRGAYPALRQFLTALRTEMRLVSLEQVQFERQKVGDAQVDARVRLVFFLGAAS